MTQTEQFDLFSFDFTEENEALRKDKMSEKKVAAQFSKLQKMFKERGNGYYLNRDYLPKDMLDYLDEFERLGWIEKRDQMVNIPNEHLDYHTTDEVTDNFREMVNHIASQPDVNWYEDILRVINMGASPVRFKSEEIREEVWKRRKKITIETAFKFGLKHFIEVPAARGPKMDPIDTKWAKDHVLPVITEKVLSITEYEEMEKYFRTTVFFMGRRDWFKKGYPKGYTIPAYPEFKRISPSTFDTVCLCEATTAREVKLILEYAGSVYGHQEEDSNRFDYVYPEGWSYEKYQDSLTDEDRRVIEADKERIRKLHARL